MSAALLRIRAVLVLVSLLTIAIIVPLVSWMVLGRMLKATTDASLLYQLHALCSIGILTYCLHYFLKRNQSDEHRATALILYSASLQILFVVNQASVRSSWDYAQIERAAGQILKGLSPYDVDTTYVLYPPLYAQAMAGGFSLLSFILRQADEAKIWNLLFYLFQNLQLAASLATLWCAFKFSRNCNYTFVHAALISTAVTALSAPFCATIVGHQVNIFIAATILLGLVYFRIAPALAGIGVAIGTFLKVYPALLIVVWLWHRQWRPALFAIGSIVLLISLQTLAGGGIHVWTDYLATARSYINSLPTAPPGWVFISPGLVAINYHLWNTLTAWLHISSPNLVTCALIAKGESLLLAIYFTFRCFTLPKSIPKDFALLERACNLLSLLLLTGPSALMPHYTIAIPIVIWTFHQGYRRSPILTVISTMLILSATPRNLCPFALQSIGLLIATGIRVFKPKNAET